MWKSTVPLQDVIEEAAQELRALEQSIRGLREILFEVERALGRGDPTGMEMWIELPRREKEDWTIAWEEKCSTIVYVRWVTNEEGVESPLSETLRKMSAKALVTGAERVTELVMEIRNRAREHQERVTAVVSGIAKLKG